jgi:P-type conjugative transfer protein TrbJ
MQTRLWLALVLLLGVTPAAQAQWSVIDEAAGLQRTLIWAEEAVQWAESLANQVKEIEATYNVIYRQIEQYETMIRNLQRLPEGLNFTEVVNQWASTLAGLLGNANIVSYDLNVVLSQFDALYRNVGSLQAGRDVLAVRQRLLTGRMQASQITVQVTAIQGNLVDLYSRICALLSGSFLAQGNLDIQQVQAQQNGLIQHTLQTMATMQATHARNTAQYYAEQATLEQLQLQAIQGAMGSAAPLGEPQGALPKFHW